MQVFALVVMLVVGGGGVEKLRNKTMALHASTMTGVRPAPINGTGDMKNIGINFVGSVHFDRPAARR